MNALLLAATLTAHHEPIKQPEIHQRHLGPVYFLAGATIGAVLANNLRTHHHGQVIVVRCDEDGDRCH